MIVTVRGSSDDNGRSWHADRIEYDNELKGPVSSLVDDPANIIPGHDPEVMNLFDAPSAELEGIAVRLA